MIVLGIDPGVATIGFGLIEADRGRQCLLRYGVITTPAGLVIFPCEYTEQLNFYTMKEDKNNG